VSAILCDPAASANPAAARLFATVRRKLSARRAAWQLARAIRTQQRERYAVAFRCFKAAARAGNPEAQYRLGLAYARGEGVIRHPPDAVRWYGRAAEQGHLEAQFQLSLIYLHGQRGAGEDWYRAAVASDRQAAEWNRDLWFASGISVPSDYAEALRWSGLAAEQGRAEAQANLGSLYLRGLGCAQDRAKARHWYELAAAQGNAEGEYGLGMIYANGLGVAVDLTAAARFYALAAEKDDDGAQTALGLMYVSGQGVERDPYRAAALFRQAAGQGNARARYNLGLLHLRGEGLTRDEAAAEASFRDAARLGHGPAMLSLAQLCGSRRRSPSEMAEALLWYKAAAAAGNAEAQFILGRLHAEGEGVRQQLSEAIRWFEKASEQGHAAAQLSLALLYWQGSGVLRDRAKTIEWYARAAEQGSAVQVRLAHLHLVGEAAASDQQTTARWLERAAGRGEREAETALALLYLRGDGVPRDIARAEALLRRAAERGHGPGCLEFGHLYSGRHGAEARESEAAGWYPAAAAAGEFEAQLLLAYNLLNGIGRAPDAAAAAQWLQKAAEQGDSGAQFQLGVLYYLGQGVERDPTAAGKWYRLAAEQGDRFAQHNLAEMLFNGAGVERDPAQAAAWYEKSAAQGTVESAVALRELHAVVRGVERDLETAGLWYEKEAGRGGENAAVLLTDLVRSGEIYPPTSRSDTDQQRDDGHEHRKRWAAHKVDRTGPPAAATTSKQNERRRWAVSRKEPPMTKGEPGERRRWAVAQKKPNATSPPIERQHWALPRTNLPIAASEQPECPDLEGWPTVSLGTLGIRNVTLEEFRVMMNGGGGNAPVYAVETAPGGSAVARVLDCDEYSEPRDVMRAYLGVPRRLFGWESETLTLLNRPCYLAVGSGVVFLGDGKIVRETVYPAEQPLSAGTPQTVAHRLGGGLSSAKNLSFQLRRAPLLADGIWAPLLSRWSSVYGHAISESLVQDSVLHRAGFSPLISFAATSYPEAAQHIVTARAHAPITSFLHPIVKVPRLVFASKFYRHFPLGAELRNAVHDVKARILARAGLCKPAHERIYVSRLGEPVRPMTNEADLIGHLSGMGFHVVSPRSMSFEDQVLTFRGARLIVGPYGSGLVNSVFAAPDAALCELRPLNTALESPLWDTYYYCLAATMHFSYAAHMSANPPNVDTWQCDIPKVLALIRAATDAIEQK
jgi:TPR repeat protein/capsular polysaccharide biosynthesis protein